MSINYEYDPFSYSDSSTEVQTQRVIEQTRHLVENGHTIVRELVVISPTYIKYVPIRD